MKHVVRGSATLQHDRLLQLINGVKLHAVVDSLLHGPRTNGVIHPIRVVGAHVWLNAGDISRRRYAIEFRAMYDGAQSCCTVKFTRGGL